MSLRSDLALGVRLSLGLGRASIVRYALMAFAIGSCVTLLLIAASIGPADQARQERIAARTPALLLPDDSGAVTGQPTLEVYGEMLRSGPITVYGWSVAALNAAAQPPPGLSALPGPGQLAVSPQV